MSSKGRKVDPENLSEFFPTPKWCTHRFIERATFLPNGAWFEPCAGNGDIIQAVNDIRPSKKINWYANEIREECKPLLSGLTDKLTFSNFLQWEEGGPRKFDVIITNPPFSLAMAIIKKSLALADYVVMLTRLNFVGSTKRTAFFNELMPDIYVIPERPSFDGKGADSIEYSWLLWKQPESRKRSRGSIELLGTTPKDVRKSHKPDLKLTDQMRLLLTTGESGAQEEIE